MSGDSASPRGDSCQVSERTDRLSGRSCPRGDEGTRPAQEVARRGSDGTLLRALDVLRVQGGRSGQKPGLATTSVGKG